MRCGGRRAEAGGQWRPEGNGGGGGVREERRVEHEFDERALQRALVERGAQPRARAARVRVQALQLRVARHLVLAEHLAHARPERCAAPESGASAIFCFGFCL